MNTLDGQNIVAVNGTQTMSHAYVVLLREMADLAAKGVHRFRLSPQDVDMVAVARLVRDVVDERIDADAAMARLPTIIGDVPTINGYMHGREGRALVAGAP